MVQESFEGLGSRSNPFKEVSTYVLHILFSGKLVC